MVCALLFHAYYVTFPSCDCNTCDMILSYTFLCVVSPKEKKSKVNINNDLVILPSHNTPTKVSLKECKRELHTGTNKIIMC